MMKNTILCFLLALCMVGKAINPEREYRFTPEMRGLTYTEYQTETPDHFNINVWEYKLPDTVKTHRTIIIVGTDAGNMGYVIWQAKAFMRKGIRVISFDYRGFGKSSDFKINRDFLFYNEFATDLDSVIKSTRQKYPTDAIGLYALSMGTYISLIKSEKTDFLIAEGFYQDPQTVANRIKANKNETVLLPSPARKINRIRIPAMIFCANHDKTTVTDDARQFARRSKVTIVEFEGEHLHGLNVFTKSEPGDEYADKVVQFLEDLSL